jgi:hypothetical protein
MGRPGKAGAKLLRELQDGRKSGECDREHDAEPDSEPQGLRLDAGFQLPYYGLQIGFNGR